MRIKMIFGGVFPFYRGWSYNALYVYFMKKEIDSCFRCIGYFPFWIASVTFPIVFYTLPGIFRYISGPDTKVSTGFWFTVQYRRVLLGFFPYFLGYCRSNVSFLSCFLCINLFLRNLHVSNDNILANHVRLIFYRIKT